MTGFPRIRQATPDDFDALLEIRDRVAVDLLERGLQWNPNALTWEHLDGWTKAGALWVADLDGKVVGAIAVWLYDPVGWWPRADLAGYVRDLMIDPAHRHQGLGAHLLAWAERYIAGLGRSRVRLDCAAENTRLFRYYVEAGYGYVQNDQHGSALFEKRL